MVIGTIPKSEGRGYQNLIEIGLMKYLDNVVFSGLEKDGGGWPNWVQANGTELPFHDGEFDLVFSNAVIEHVGDEAKQIIFVNEHIRVGHKFILTTPNRLFPIESHTQTFFRHMSGKWIDPSFSRLLSKSDLERIVPISVKIRGSNFSPTLLAHN